MYFMYILCILRTSLLKVYIMYILVIMLAVTYWSVQCRCSCRCLPRILFPDHVVTHFSLVTVLTRLWFLYSGAQTHLAEVLLKMTFGTRKITITWAAKMKLCNYVTIAAELFFYHTLARQNPKQWNLRH